MSSESWGVGGGVTPDVKWLGWLSGYKNQNPKKSVGLWTKPSKISGPKINRPPPKKKSHEEFLSPKNVRKVGCTLFTELLRPEYAGTTTNLQIVFNTQNNPYLNQAIQKIPAKFSYPKKILELKTWNHKKSLDHPHHLRSWVLPWALNKTAREICLFN